MQKSGIRRARTVDELTAAGPLFDRPAVPGGTPTPFRQWGRSARFLLAPGHHLFLAYEDDEPVGFVSGVETIHPDKGVETFLYELSVAEAYRRRGIGRSLVEALAALARERGCYGMWVGVDTDNAPALATYRGAGGRDGGGCSVVEWSFV